MDLPKLTPEQQAQVDEFARKLNDAGHTEHAENLKAAAGTATTPVGRQLARKALIFGFAAVGLALSGAFSSTKPLGDVLEQQYADIPTV